MIRPKYPRSRAFGRHDQNVRKRGGKKPPCEKDLYRRAGYDGLEKRPYPASVPEAEAENLTYILQVFSFGFYIQAVS